jgi:hypothetical protein
MKTTDNVHNFSQQTNYTVLSLLVYNTLKSIDRFKKLDDEVVMRKIYSSIKTCVGNVNQ